MTRQSRKKCNVCQRKGELVHMRVPRSGPAQLSLYPGFRTQVIFFAALDNISVHLINPSISFHACSQSLCTIKCIFVHTCRLYCAKLTYLCTEFISAEVHKYFHNTTNGDLNAAQHYKKNCTQHRLLRANMYIKGILTQMDHHRSMSHHN